MGIGHRISEFLRETPPDRRLEALYKPLQPQDPESNRSQCPGARGLHSQLSEQELLHAAISASKVPTGGNLSCPSNTSMRKVIHDEKGERERNEGEHAIKLILMTLIRRFGSTANDSIKRMTLGLFCHHLGSCPPPCHYISKVLAMTTGWGDGQRGRDGDRRHRGANPLSTHWLLITRGQAFWLAATGREINRIMTL